MELPIRLTSFWKRLTMINKIAVILISLFALLAVDTGKAAEPITPKESIQLFNGKDLDGWTTYLKESADKDPDGVFQVSDGMIHISGNGFGYLATESSYANYHLSLEFKWGKKDDGSGYVRNSGVMLHSIGPDRVWPASIEVQLAQGCEGDFICIGGKQTDGSPIATTLKSNVRIAEDKKSRWSADGEPLAYSGRQFWWSKHQPFFKEKLDTRGKDDVASPLGEWTKVDCICRGGKIRTLINGEAVNEAFDVFPAAGRIMLQNEGSEVYFRNVEIRPLKSP